MLSTIYLSLYADKVTLFSSESTSKKSGASSPAFGTSPLVLILFPCKVISVIQHHINQNNLFQ